MCCLPEVWARAKVRKRDDQRRRLIDQKESVRWLRSLEVTERLVVNRTRVVTVGDREADIYELFSLARSRGSEFLIRAAQDRQTTSAEADDDFTALFATVKACTCRGQFGLKLQRTPRRAARTTLLSVRFTRLWLRPPRASERACADRRHRPACPRDAAAAQQRSADPVAAAHNAGCAGLRDGAAVSDVVQLSVAD